jgi:hypothetical protein
LLPSHLHLLKKKKGRCRRENFFEKEKKKHRQHPQKVTRYGKNYFLTRSAIKAITNETAAITPAMSAIPSVISTVVAPPMIKAVTSSARTTQATIFTTLLEKKSLIF